MKVLEGAFNQESDCDIFANLCLKLALVTDLHQRTRGLPRLVVDVGGHGPAQEGRAQVDRDAGEPADRGEVRLPRIDFVFFIRVDSSSV